MPMQSVTFRRTLTKLVPLYPKPEAWCLPVNLAPSTTFVAGTVLGVAGAAANDVQTMTTTGTPTGGKNVVTVVDPISGLSTTFDVPFDATNTIAQTNIRAALGNSDVAVTGGAQPGTALVFTFSGRYASLPVLLMTVNASGLTGGTTPAASFAHTTQGRTANTYAAYVGGGATDPAKCLLEHDCVTDAAGNITYGSSAFNGEGIVRSDTPAFFGGAFKCSDLTGLDAGAVVDLGVVLKAGTVSDGYGILVF